MVVRGEVKGVTLDRDDEGGEVAVDDDPPELLFGDEHAGGSCTTPRPTPTLCASNPSLAAPTSSPNAS